MSKPPKQLKPNPATSNEQQEGPAPDIPALALALAQASDTLTSAAARATTADQAMSGLEAWQKYHQARRIAEQLKPVIPTLPGYGEWAAAVKAKEDADQAYTAALEAWRQAHAPI